MKRDLMALGLLGILGCGGTDSMTRPSTPPPVNREPAASASAPPGVTPKYAYPATRVTDTVDTLHGVRVADPYRWLEDGAAEEVKSWAQAQNAFTRSVLDPLPEREALRTRFRELFDIEQVGPPLRRGQRYFWGQKDVGQEKDTVLWRQGKNGPKKVLLDPNTWSADGSVSLGGYSVSWDGKLVTYQV
jgi:prolyl oligopeptidase